MNRRAAGLILYAVGAALLLDVGVTYARSVMASDAARAAWEREQAHRSVLTIKREVERPYARTATLALGAPMAHLVIPAIGLDEIVVEGVGEDQLNAGPGHMPGSALPGDPGNAVISAHRDRHFHALDHVAVGDTIITTTDRGRVTWVVVGRHIVPSDARALFDTHDATLTLTTCWPVRYLGPAPDRLLITARPALVVSRAAADSRATFTR